MTNHRDDLNYSTTRRRLAIALFAGALIAGVIAGVVTAPNAKATGRDWCDRNPDHPKCQPIDECSPSDPCEPVPCAEGEIRDETGECVPEVVECAEGEVRDADGNCVPVVEPPVDPEPPVVTPDVDAEPIPRDPPMPAIDQGKKRPVTTEGCGWSRTEYPNGRVTWGDGIDCGDVNEEGF